MGLEVLCRTTDVYEAGQLVARLRAVGIDAVLHGGSQASLFGGAQHLIEQQLLVPSEQLEQACAFLKAEPVLEGTEASGEALANAVCAVHELRAVATCVRCGNFLCAQCGSLGNPPLCEDCMERPEPKVERSPWAKNLARLWVGSYVGSIAVAVLVTLVALLW